MRFRTDVENLFLEELVEEDATFLVNGYDDNVDGIVAANTNINNGLFDDSSSEEGFEDTGELFDDDDDNLEDKILFWED